MIKKKKVTLNLGDEIEILSSLGMNIIVAIGFWIEYKAHVKELNNK